LAVLLGLAPLVAVELGLRLAGVDFAPRIEDPFAVLAEVRPLFERTADGTRWEITPERRHWFALDGFPAVKPAGQKRVFVVGGSTVAGHPYDTPTSFGAWLELQLRAAEPDTEWDVVICGAASYAAIGSRRSSRKCSGTSRIWSSTTRPTTSIWKSGRSGRGRVAPG
jgi:hypothetical protein